MHNFFHGGILSRSLALAALLAGCGGDGKVGSMPDPMGEPALAADPAATDPAPAVADPAPAAAPTLPDVSGTMLLAVSVAIIRDTPVYFLTHAKLTPASEGTPAALELRAAPLGAYDRMPVAGAAELVVRAPVAADGSFSVDLGTVTIPAAANPLEAGDIVAKLQLKGRLASTDVICGDVQGQVMAPLALDLDGSTFAFARVSDGTVGAALPSPAMSACPR